MVCVTGSCTLMPRTQSGIGTYSQPHVVKNYCHYPFGEVQYLCPFPFPSRKVRLEGLMYGKPGGSCIVLHV